MPVLLEAVSRHQKRFYGLDVDPGSEVLVTAGATEAIAATLLALVDVGDEVVTLEPFYDSYGAIIALARGIHRTVPLRRGGVAPAGDASADFRVDHDELRRAVTDRTRVILVNDPHNPTGAVLDDATRRLIVELAERHDAIIVSDEVYEHLTFDGIEHVPMVSVPGARERSSRESPRRCNTSVTS